MKKGTILQFGSVIPSIIGVCIFICLFTGRFYYALIQKLGLSASAQTDIMLLSVAVVLFIVTVVLFIVGVKLNKKR
jgi:hypothetical protein